MSADQDSAKRWPITISIMLATVMNSLDTTIANVALPHIQGSVSASQEQITWVLTSYIVAAAIMTPMSGWLAIKFGRKNLFLVSIFGFTLASMACGISNNLVEIVLARVLQGMFGAALIPISQAVLLDINPPEKHGQAMSIWGAGAILGPVIGPALGGWLTDNLSWRWVFFINLPIGIMAFTGVWLFISGDKSSKPKPFDFLGFGALVLFIAGFQLVLDRGPSLDWYSSPEIWAETLLAVMALWIFIFHTISAANPFFDRALARDRNFLTATVFGFFIMIILFSAMALLPPMMQGLMGYPVLTAGLVSMPRGIGLFMTMLTVGSLIGRVQTRFILLVGLILCAISQWQMMHFDLMMGETPFMISGFFQGLGIGLIFVPLSTLAFATVAPALRGEASSLFNLVRNLGSSVGISIMQALLVSNTQAAHAGLTERIDPSNPMVVGGLGSRFDLSTVAGLEGLNAEVNRQAAMIAYIDDFKVMLVITLCCIPMLLLLKQPKRVPGEAVHAVID